MNHFRLVRCFRNKQYRPSNSRVECSKIRFFSFERQWWAVYFHNYGQAVFLSYPVRCPIRLSGGRGRRRDEFRCCLASDSNGTRKTSTDKPYCCRRLCLNPFRFRFTSPRRSISRFVRFAQKHGVHKVATYFCRDLQFYALLVNEHTKNDRYRQLNPKYR